MLNFEIYCETLNARIRAYAIYLKYFCVFIYVFSKDARFIKEKTS